jgi:hypothetical protein
VKARFGGSSLKQVKSESDISAFCQN